MNIRDPGTVYNKSPLNLHHGRLLLRWLVYLFAISLAIIAGLVVYLVNTDLGRFKDRIVPALSDALGRPVVIDGPLSMNLGRSLQIAAEQVQVAHLSGGDTPAMLEFDRLEAVLDIGSVLMGPLRFEAVEIQGGVVRLQIADSGRIQWSGAAPATRSRVQGEGVRRAPQVSRFMARDIRLLVSTPLSTRPAEVEVSEAVVTDQDGRVVSRAVGEVSGVSLQIDSEVLPGLDYAGPRPATIAVVAATAALRFSTRLALADLGSLNEATLSLEFSGPDISQIPQWVRQVAGLAEISGGPRVPALPFLARGQGRIGDRQLVLESATLNLDGHPVSMSGWLGQRADGPAMELEFATRELNPSRWIQVDGLELPVVSATGVMRLVKSRLVLEDLRLDSDAAAVTGGAEILADADGGRRFELRLEAASASAFGRELGDLPLPDEPLSIQGNGLLGAQTLQVQGLGLSLADRGLVTGEVEFSWRDRPHLHVALNANRLDLMPTGEGPASETPSARDRLIPGWPIPMGWTSHLDADFEIAVESLKSPVTASASFRSAGELRNGELVVDEVLIDGRRGRLQGKLQAAPGDQAPVVRLGMTGENIRIAPAGESEESLAKRPAYQMTADLEASGGDLRSLAASLDGKVRLTGGAGTVPRRSDGMASLVFEDFLSRLLQSINPVMRKREELQLNCIVLHLDFSQGSASGEPFFALQAREFNLLARGSVDLATEILDLDFAAQPRRGVGVSLGDLINPLTRVGGTLASPKIVSDPKSALVAVGGGIATGGLLPLAKKLRERFLGGNPCTKALNQSEGAGG